MPRITALGLVEAMLQLSQDEALSSDGRSAAALLGMELCDRPGLVLALEEPEAAPAPFEAALAAALGEGGPCTSP